MSTHSNIFACKILWTERSLAVYIPWGGKQLNTTERTHTHTHTHKHTMCKVPGSQMVKNLPTLQETPGFCPWFRKIPWRRKWQPTPVYLPREFYGQRSLAGYSPWGCKQSDTTNTSLHFRHSDKSPPFPSTSSLINNMKARVWKKWSFKWLGF